MKKSRTVHPTAGVESPTTRRLPLVELLINTEAQLFDLAVRSGLQVLDAMLEEDRTAICGPRYAHQADRTASRGAGSVPVRAARSGCERRILEPACPANQTSRRSRAPASGTLLASESFTITVLIVNRIPRTCGDESGEGNLVGVTPYSISASGWPDASALIQARQRSRERYRPYASVSWRSTMGKVE